MTDRFNPDTHKFGMAYRTMKGPDFLPCNDVYYPYGDPVYGDDMQPCVCISPIGETEDGINWQCVERAPEHDLVPRQDVAGDAQKQLDEEERSHNNTVEQRDRAEGMADKLAQAIADYFGEDVGEHSNMNCPWQQALKIIEEAHPRPAVTDDDKRVALDTLPDKGAFGSNAWLRQNYETIRALLSPAQEGGAE